MPGVHATMHEFKHGTLHSGSKHGPVVKDRKQAIAIALSEKRKEEGDQDGDHEFRGDGAMVAKADATATRRGSPERGNIDLRSVQDVVEDPSGVKGTYSQGAADFADQVKRRSQKIKSRRNRS